MKTFKIANRDFKYPVEHGVIVMKIKKNNYFLHYSDWIAKTLLEWEHMVNVDPFLKEFGLPLKFIDKYLWVPHYSRVISNRDTKVIKEQSLMAFINSIYFRYCEKYGADKVKCSNHPYYGQEKMEHKTKWIDEQLNVFPYEELIGYCDGTRRNT